MRESRAPPGDWRPTAGLDALRARAQLLAAIRSFFAAQDVMEVETPVLAGAGVSDPNLRNLATACSLLGDEEPRVLYLQTSPEYAMKRLLAAGSGAIFQICKVFREGEAGRRHNPEFTILEWYRPGFDYEAMMDDTQALLQRVLPVTRCERMSYSDAMRRHAGIEMRTATIAQLRERAAEAGIAVSAADELGRNDWLDLLLSHLVAPRLGIECPIFLTDFPASQAALARTAAHDGEVAERFEVFIGGMEIANGFHELSDAHEQRRRFDSDNARRRAAGQSVVVPDERLLAALDSGLPDCSGVALGLDRLLMVALGAASISEVQAFTSDRA